ncbi:hypothetical protein LEMLEM_LOCUS4028 [Lemmus lemmus]
MEKETEPTLENWTELPPRVQMKRRRRENMSKDVRTTRGVPTH